MESNNTILGSGNCRVVWHPYERGGVEGFEVGDILPYQKLNSKKNGKVYYRLYSTSGSVKSGADPNCYQVCSPKLFKDCFEEVVG